MKKYWLLIPYFIFVSNALFAQPWNFDFGIGSGSHTSGESLTFLPDPQTGGGANSRVRIGSGGGSLNLENQVISFGSQSYLRGVAPTSTSVNKFSIYDFTTGQSFTIRFSIRFGASDGSSTGADDGEWFLFIGDGATYSNNAGFSTAEVFTGIRWRFATSGAIETAFRDGTTWSSSGISGTPFSQGTDYIVDIYSNNSSSTINYTYGSSQSVASNKFDLWVGGTLVGDDLNKAGLTDLNNIDSWMFYGIGSTSNVANCFVDDIYYTNEIASTPLPVELTSFSASIIDEEIKLHWITETEVSNYGFEILRSTQNDEWDVLGFVEGHGNSNSPKEYSFVDNNVTAGKYSYRLKQLDTDGKFEYSKIIEVDLDTPLKYELTQNYPNPFNPSTSILFSLPISGNVKLVVYNLLGEQVAELVNGFKEAGVHTINFNAENLNSGIYIYKLEANGFLQSRKMALLK